jgi:hypothetical protein
MSADIQGDEHAGVNLDNTGRRNKKASAGAYADGGW